MEDEVWKEISGLDGFYEVSNKSRIRSWKEMVRNNKGQFSGRIKRADSPHILTKSVNAHGYHSVCIKHNNKYMDGSVARIVAKAFVPNPHNKPEVNHIDGVKTNDMPYNLEWCTRSENVQHAFDTGLKIPASGENHGMSKLTENQVKEIRMVYKNENTTHAELGKRYDVHPSLIGYITRREIWKDV